MRNDTHTVEIRRAFKWTYEQYPETFRWRRSSGTGLTFDPTLDLIDSRVPPSMIEGYRILLTIPQSALEERARGTISEQDRRVVNGNYLAVQSLLAARYRFDRIHENTGPLDDLACRVEYDLR